MKVVQIVKNNCNNPTRYHIELDNKKFDIENFDDLKNYKADGEECLISDNNSGFTYRLNLNPKDNLRSLQSIVVDTADVILSNIRKVYRMEQ
ncbi:MAG: hypothetical protein RSE41_09020 [Clostridia bacterium]